MRYVAGAIALLLAGCSNNKEPAQDYYGTLEPFASEAVYFVVTDRFVDGDSSNNYPQQGGAQWGSFDRPVTDTEGRSGNVGYLGGDFRGLLDNADYIAEMGFTAVWITPIVENPDQAFSGSSKIGEGMFADNGKAGYHGYWGVNFYETDEHLVSPGLNFEGLTQSLRERHGLKTVLDVVCNHGSPSYTMPADQPMFGELYDRDGVLVADHENLHPTELDPANPLHAYFHNEPDLAELSNLNDENPAVVDYCAGAYLQWAGQGADAFRIDTIRHMPHAFWKQFSDRIRAAHPGFFMFGESFDYEAANIATHTWPENGGISVLDFPGKASMNEVFAEGAAYSHLLDYLLLVDGPYDNPYNLMTFYDNHDMPRMAADADGFVDAHNWLFTSRGIPVVYYGSESAFRAGMPEHGGNRDYFGGDGIAAARDGRIRRELAEIANVRKASPALQRGLQANLAFAEDTALFLRVLQHDGTAQTALVMLNKGDADVELSATRWLDSGTWREALSGETRVLSGDAVTLTSQVPAHGVRVWLRDGAVSNPALVSELERLQAGAQRKSQ